MHVATISERESHTNSTAAQDIDLAQRLQFTHMHVHVGCGGCTTAVMLHVNAHVPELSFQTHLGRRCALRRSGDSQQGRSPHHQARGFASAQHPKPNKQCKRVSPQKHAGPAATHVAQRQHRVPRLPLSRLLGCSDGTLGWSHAPNMPSYQSFWTRSILWAGPPQPFPLTLSLVPLVCGEGLTLTLTLTLTLRVVPLVSG